LQLLECRAELLMKLRPAVAVKHTELENGRAVNRPREAKVEERMHIASSEKLEQRGEVRAWCREDVAVAHRCAQRGAKAFHRGMDVSALRTVAYDRGRDANWRSI
jgi:hypothetical protein